MLLKVTQTIYFWIKILFSLQYLIVFNWTSLIMYWKYLKLKKWQEKRQIFFVCFIKNRAQTQARADVKHRNYLSWPKLCFGTKYLLTFKVFLAKNKILTQTQNQEIHFNCIALLKYIKFSAKKFKLTETSFVQK